MPGRDGSQGRMKNDTRDKEGPGRAKPRKLEGKLVKTQRGKVGANAPGIMAYTGIRFRAAETIGRGWRGARVEDVRVYIIPPREMRWGAGEKQSTTKTNGY